MRQAAVAVRTKQISTELKSHPYPLHKHDGLCAYVCVKFNHLSPANEQSSFPCVWNKPVKGVVTNLALVCTWICARSWTFVYPCKRMCLPRRGSSRLLTQCETVSMRCVQGAGESPLVKITQSGANEHGSANRGTCQEITQPFWNHSQRFNSGASCSSESSGLLWVFPRAASPPVLSASGAQKRSSHALPRGACWSASRISRGCYLEVDELFALRTLPRLHLPHFKRFRPVLLLKSRLIKRASVVCQLMRSTPLVAFLSIFRCKKTRRNLPAGSESQWPPLTVSYLPLTL